jgi:zinc transport system substrate-binding protein
VAYLWDGRWWAAITALVLAVAAPARGAPVPNVVASIVPIHALAAAVLDTVGEPHLLVHGNASPHSYQLRPSDARELEAADLVIWVGPRLEAFLERPLGSLARHAKRLELAEAEGVRLLPARSGGPWEADADDHGHMPQGSHASPLMADADIDPHIWLDPANAQAIVRAIAAALGDLDPERADLYAANAARSVAALGTLDGELRSRLAPVRDKPFAVFHDAYRYLEAAYGLKAVGSITVSPDRPPSAARLQALGRKLQESGAACVFGELQTPAPVVDALAEMTGARTGTLDPEGTSIADPGPQAYAELMRRNAQALVDCLDKGGA